LHAELAICDRLWLDATVAAVMVQEGHWRSQWHPARWRAVC